MSLQIRSSPSLSFADSFFVVGFDTSSTLRQQRTSSNSLPSEKRGSGTVESLQKFNERRRSSLKPESLTRPISKPPAEAHASPDPPKSAPTSVPASTTPTGAPKPPHPLELRFETSVLYRYPHDDQERQKFPAYLPLFCFPDDMRFMHSSDGTPSTTHHSFVITEDMGVRRYGVCLTIYERPPPDIRAELEEMIREWERAYVLPSDIEYFRHLQSQLKRHKERLDRARSGILDPGEIDIESTVMDSEERVALFTELIEPVKDTLLADIDNVYLPRTIGVLSHWPWHSVLKDWLCELVSMFRDCGEVQTRTLPTVPIERYLVNLIHEIPLPPPGKLELAISIGELRLFCARPPVNSISSVHNFSMYPIFRSMSLSNIVLLFELLLAERKIIFTSSYLSMLTLAAEMLCSIFFPLQWQHIFIPILPEKLLNYLQAPMPYIVGVHREYLPVSDGDDGIPRDAALIDLDNDMCILLEHPPTLPQKERKKLLYRLQKHSGMSILPYPDLHARGVPSNMRVAFPIQKHIPQSCESYRTRLNDSLKVTRKSEFTAISRAKSKELLEKITKMTGDHRSSPEGAMHSKNSSILSINTSLDSYASLASKRLGSTSFDNLKENRGPKGSELPSGMDSMNPHALLPEESEATDQVSNLGRRCSQQEPDELASPTTGRLMAIFRTASSSSREHKMQESVKKDTMHTSPSASSLSSFFSSLSHGGGNALTRAISPNRNREKSPLDGRGKVKDDVAYDDIKDDGRTLSDKEDRVSPLSRSGSTAISQKMGSVGSLLKRTEGHALYETTVDSILKDKAPASDGGMTPTSGRERGSLRPPSTSSGTDTSEIVCDLCQKDINNLVEIKVWKCQQCSLLIHASCLGAIECRPCRAVFHEHKLQSAFFKVFTSLLKCYRQFLVLHEKSESASGSHSGLFPTSSNLSLTPNGLQDMLQSDWFHKDDFLDSFDRDARPFMNVFVETQAFSQFTLDRIERAESDWENLFFDESIKAKLNRSKLKFSKETTPFLEDKSYSISQTISTIFPNYEDIMIAWDPNPSCFPSSLVEELICPPRHIPPLLTQSDQRMMLSRTTELVQRARSANSAKRNQDFGKWMKSKLKHFQKVGGGEVVGIGFLSDEQRRDMFEQRLREVSAEIDIFEAAHLSSQTKEDIQNALSILHNQNLRLMYAVNEEQLVESADEEELQRMLTRLVRVITIYQDHLNSMSPDSALLPWKREASLVEPVASDSPLSITQTPERAHGHSPLQVTIVGAAEVSTTTETESDVISPFTDTGSILSTIDIAPERSSTRKAPLENIEEAPDSGRTDLSLHVSREDGLHM